MNKLVLLALLFMNFKVEAQSFEPGLWKSKESLVINGIPLPSSTDEECITKAQAKDAKATLEKELKRKGCSITQWSYKNNSLEAGIKCKNSDMDAVGKIRGSFTNKSYNLTGEAKGTYKNVLPALARLKLSGERKAVCK